MPDTIDTIEEYMSGLEKAYPEYSAEINTILINYMVEYYFYSPDDFNACIDMLLEDHTTIETRSHPEWLVDLNEEYIEYKRSFLWEIYTNIKCILGDTLPFK